MNPVHISPSCFFKIYFNFAPSHLRLGHTNGFFNSRFSDRHFLCISLHSRIQPPPPPPTPSVLSGDWFTWWSLLVCQNSACFGKRSGCDDTRSKATLGLLQFNTQFISTHSNNSHYKLYAIVTRSPQKHGCTTLKPTLSYDQRNEGTVKHYEKYPVLKIYMNGGLAPHFLNLISVVCYDVLC